ncbi:MAG: helix-hairpin-helix domain-containing protein [Balneolaceae bacterium]
MSRKLFFFLEQLQIPRRERIAVGFFAALGLFFLTSVYFLDQKVYYDKAYYEELDRLFAEKSRMAELERAQIYQRYDSAVSAVTDSIGEDSVKMDGENYRERRININLASASRLRELPGIGPAYAQRIIDWRNKYGAFTSAEQLLEIRGIGSVRLDAIRPLITLRPVSGNDSLLHDGAQ